MVDGRRWRASDPSLVDDVRQELVDELMAARRAVRAGRGDEAAVRAARARVQDAKVALGERGAPWWEPLSASGVAARAVAAARALRHRRDGVTPGAEELALLAGRGDPATWRAVVAEALADLDP